MTRSVVSAQEQDSIATVGTIADWLAQHRIKRVPIMRDKTVASIMSRADIVRAMARMPQDDLADF
ncbi:MAG TPA: hypothetical protein PLC74_03745 [Acetobacteraceae bacterium]|nr:hypothetical protein [Acetobacteraceae bacterium]